MPRIVAARDMLESSLTVSTPSPPRAWALAASTPSTHHDRGGRRRRRAPCYAAAAAAGRCRRARQRRFDGAGPRASRLGSGRRRGRQRSARGRWRRVHASRAAVVAFLRGTLSARRADDASGSLRRARRRAAGACALALPAGGGARRRTPEAPARRRRALPAAHGRQRWRRHRAGSVFAAAGARGATPRAPARLATAARARRPARAAQGAAPSSVGDRRGAVHARSATSAIARARCTARGASTCARDAAARCRPSVEAGRRSGRPTCCVARATNVGGWGVSQATAGLAPPNAARVTQLCHADAAHTSRAPATWKRSRALRRPGRAARSTSRTPSPAAFVPSDGRGAEMRAHARARTAGRPRIV